MREAVFPATTLALPKCFHAETKEVETSVFREIAGLLGIGAFVRIRMHLDFDRRLLMGVQRFLHDCGVTLFCLCSSPGCLRE